MVHLAALLAGFGGLLVEMVLLRRHGLLLGNTAAAATVDDDHRLAVVLCFGDGLPRRLAPSLGVLAGKQFELDPALFKAGGLQRIGSL